MLAEHILQRATCAEKTTDVPGVFWQQIEIPAVHPGSSSRTTPVPSSACSLLSGARPPRGGQTRILNARSDRSLPWGSPATSLTSTCNIFYRRLSLFGNYVH